MMTTNLMAEVRRPRTRASISYLLLWLVTGIKKYGPAFLLECIIFYLALLAYQAIGYFGRFGPVEAISLGLLLVPICMAAGEATFRLYRRVWVVAGLQDAIAIALAVAEAALILTLLNRLIPSDIRPYRFPVPCWRHRRPPPPSPCFGCCPFCSRRRPVPGTVFSSSSTTTLATDHPRLSFT